MTEVDELKAELARTKELLASAREISAQRAQEIAKLKDAILSALRHAERAQEYLERLG